MKNVFKSFTIIAVMAMLVFAFASCDSSASDDNLGGGSSKTSLEGTWYLREPSDPQRNYAMLKFTGRNLTVGTMLGGVYFQYSGSFTLTDTEINYTINEIGSGTTTYTLSSITLWINDMEGLGGTFTRDSNETPQIGNSLDDLPDPGNAFKYHDNNVKVFTCYDDEDGNLTVYNGDPWVIIGGLFEITAFDVSAGQDPDKNLKIGGRYYWDTKEQFCFRVGRHGTKEVAASFNKACPPEHNTFNHTAGELNFWMKGTLQLDLRSGKRYTFSNTYFAQGHSGATNNWWFGNDKMVNYKYPSFAYDPYDKYGSDIPIYTGDRCFGYISPDEDPDLVFKFLRGQGILGNVNDVVLIGIYTKSKVKW